MKKKDPYRPSAAVLVRLASIAVHAEEYLSDDGREVDAIDIRNLLDDRELRQWIKSMGAAAPVKRCERTK